MTRRANPRGLGRLVVHRGLGLPGGQTEAPAPAEQGALGQAQLGQLRALVVSVLAMCGVVAAYAVGPTPFGQATLWVVIVLIVAGYETEGYR